MSHREFKTNVMSFVLLGVCAALYACGVRGMPKPLWPGVESRFSDAGASTSSQVSQQSVQKDTLLTPTPTSSPMMGGK